LRLELNAFTAEDAKTGKDAKFAEEKIITGKNYVSIKTHQSACHESYALSAGKAD
jgi:hypothetical protein